jgi:uncharacterized protein DUF6929
MQKFQLELLFHIIGIGSASGLIFKGDSLFLISDNGAHLYEYGMTGQPIGKTTLIESEVGENIQKRLKPDFEAIASFGNDYYIFGSGSTENRNRMVQYNAKTKTTKVVDLTNLYLSMQSFGEITPEEFNIEGVVFNGETWYFLQRGNGKSGTNAVFTVGGKNLENDFSILFNKYKLPKIKGIRSSFTDAVLIEDELYFLACAEDSKSTYHDGEILGSFIGSINTETMKLGKTKKISDSHKFEGITLYKKTATQLELLLCEDNDTETLESDIYKLTIGK